MSTSQARIELQYYEHALPDLLLEHDGQFVVIRGEKIEGFFLDYQAALTWSYDRFGLQGFFVKKVAADQDIAHFTRDLGPCRP